MSTKKIYDPLYMISLNLNQYFFLRDNSGVIGVYNSNSHHLFIKREFYDLGEEMILRIRDSWNLPPHMIETTIAEHFSMQYWSNVKEIYGDNFCK